MKYRNLRLLLLFATVGTGSTYWVVSTGTGSATSTGEQPSHPAPLVSTQAIELQDGYHYQRTFTGQVEATRSSLLGFELGGRLGRIAVREGDRVQPGQVLAYLDTARLDAQRAELLAAIAEAEANLALTRTTLRRYDDIVERGGVSPQDRDEALKAFKAAQARLNLTRRQVDSIDVELTKTRLIAPYPGIVVSRHVDEGRVLEAGAAILELQELATPEIRVGVAGRLVDGLRVGQHYQLNAGDQRFSARLRSVLPLRSQTTRTIDAIFEPLDSTTWLRTGDLVRLTLNEFRAVPGTWLPISALTEAQRGQWGIYVTNSDNGNSSDTSHRLRRRLVDVVYHEAQRVYISGALIPGDHVVTDGLQRIVPGQQVRILTTPASLARTGTEDRHNG